MALGEGLQESLRPVNDVKLQMFEEQLTLEAIRVKVVIPKLIYAPASQSDSRSLACVAGFRKSRLHFYFSQRCEMHCSV